eukprot:12382096-Ditylum_brightwellii.AAC.2
MERRMHSILMSGSMRAIFGSQQNVMGIVVVPQWIVTGLEILIWRVQTEMLSVNSKQGKEREEGNRKR